jgi:hypothetical protein
MNIYVQIDYLYEWIKNNYNRQLKNIEKKIINGNKLSYHQKRTLENICLKWIDDNFLSEVNNDLNLLNKYVDSIDDIEFIKCYKNIVEEYYNYIDDDDIKNVMKLKYILKNYIRLKYWILINSCIEVNSLMN